MPAFPLLPFAFWVALFSDLVDTFYSRISAIVLVSLMYFALALPASSFLSFCLIVAAVTSGDSSLMIFKMKIWSLRPNRKMSRCRTDSISAL